MIGVRSIWRSLRERRRRQVVHVLEHDRVLENTSGYFEEAVLHLDSIKAHVSFPRVKQCKTERVQRTCANTRSYRKSSSRIAGIRLFFRKRR
jgi:hypothetical protein